MSKLTAAIASSGEFCGIQDDVNGNRFILTVRDESGAKKAFAVSVEETEEPSPVNLQASQTQDASGGCCQGTSCSNQVQEDSGQEAAAQDDASRQAACEAAAEGDTQDA